MSSDNESGQTRAAGEGLSDAAAVAEVSAQTSSDLKAEDVFKRESEDAASDQSAEDISADELAD
jgi:hypothetical protein